MAFLVVVTAQAASHSESHCISYREKPILFWTVKTERVYNIFSNLKKSIKKVTSYIIKLSGIINKKVPSK